MKKLFLITLLSIGLLTSCTNDSEADFMPVTFLMTYDHQNNVYQIDGGEWIGTGQPQEFHFDTSIEDDIKITATTVSFVSLEALNFPFNQESIYNEKEVIFYAKDLSEYMENEEFIYFQITLK